jgi:predicted nucleic acid-binding protein
MLEVDDIATCTPVALELLFSARSRSDYRDLAGELGSLSWAPATEAAEIEALRTQAALAERSQHRGATPVDVLVAAIAATSGLVLLHYDRHFDLIGRTTGQPVEWLARRGSLA